MKNIRKNSEKEYNKTSLVFLIISSIVLFIYAFILISAYTCCRYNEFFQYCLFCYANRDNSFWIKILCSTIPLSLFCGFIGSITYLYDD